MEIHSFLTLVRHLALGRCRKFLVARAVAGGYKSQASQEMLICHNRSVSGFCYLHARKYRFTRVD